MAAGHKNFRLRGGADADDFPAVDISIKNVRLVGRIAWEKWGHMIADHPLRDLIALAYAEGLYHGAAIATRDPKILSTIGLNPSGVSSAVAPVSSCATTAIEMPSVRDLLESL